MKDLSLFAIKQLIQKLPNWPDLQLIATKHSSKVKCVYDALMVAINPYEDLVKYANDIVSLCIGEKKPLFSDTSVAKKYDDSELEGGFSYLEVSDSLVSESWNAFKIAMRDVSRGRNPVKFKPGAIVITAVDREFFLVSIQKPVLAFTRRRVFFGKEEFHEINEDENILTLSPQIDAIAFQGRIVFLSSRGSSFFVSETAVKKKALETAEKIGELNLISNIDEFLKAVEVSRNAHWLLAVDDKRLEKIKNKKTREHVSDVFGLKYSKGRFSTETKGEIASLLKVLGKRGMFDIVESVPMEVSGSGVWKPEA